MNAFVRVAIALTAFLVACGSRTSVLEGGGSSSGDSGGGIGGGGSGGSSGAPSSGSSGGSGGSNSGSGGGSSGGSGGNGSGSGGGSGGSAFTGPNCIGFDSATGCWSCIQRACPSVASCISSECTSYFQCDCACALGDPTCQSLCTRQLSGSCNSCLESAAMCAANSCPTQCGSSMSGALATSTCGFSVVQCPNPNRPGQETTCEYLARGLCISATVQVDSQKFPCASCADQSSCQQQAAMAACR